MTTLEQRLDQLVGARRALDASPAMAASRAMPGNAFMLDDGAVLALPRDTGDSRYPYGRDGFNFWVYASGYMHANEGLFSPFLRAAEGQEPTVAFFAGLPVEGDETYQPVPLLQVPRLGGGSAGAARYTVFTPGAAYFVTELATLRFGLRAHATDQRQIIFSLHVRSLADAPQAVAISSFLNPFLNHGVYPSGEARWFREARVLDPSPEAGALAPFRFEINEDLSRTESVLHWGLVRRNLVLGANCQLRRSEETTSRYQYVGGAQSSLHTPAGVERGGFGEAPQPVTSFTETAVAADMLHLELAAGGQARLDLIFAFTDDADAMEAWLDEEVDPTAVDAALAALEVEEGARQSGLRAEVGPVRGVSLSQDVFNGFLGHLKRQVEFCSLIKGYIQLSEGSLIGIRDVFQALEGLAYWQPEATREKMLEALAFTMPSGRCPRQYSIPTDSGWVRHMDLRPFIDQGCWVISAVATYLRATGDMGFLEAPCGYHRIVDEAARSVERAPETDSVLEHLARILGYLLEHRDHGHTGCVRALFGDWNDALDGLGVSLDPGTEYGTGVSVMATLQVRQNALEMAEILGAVDSHRHAERIAQYGCAAEELEDALRAFAIIESDSGEKRLVHGWGDRRSYFVGGFEDPDGQARDGLTSNAFWVLTGMHDRDPSLGETILDAFGRLDSKYGLKTFEPFFPRDTPGVGRIPKLPPGTAENGAAYIHATAFGAMALFRMGEPPRAWEQLLKILPFTPGHDGLSHSPFVMPNSYGLNPDKGIDGQNMLDWQTGSSNVVLKCLVCFVFGYEPHLDGAWIQPAAWAPFGSFDFTIAARGGEIRVRFEDTGSATRTFRVDGDERPGIPDPIMGIDRLWIPWAEAAGRSSEICVSD